MGGFDWNVIERSWVYLFKEGMTFTLTLTGLAIMLAVLGFNMLGSRWDHTILQRWIEEQRELSWVMEHLAEAQFDVEFGRTNLGKMVESELSA